MGAVFEFGKFASGVYIFGRIGKGAPELIIGKSNGVADVGIFSRANGLVEIFNRLLLRSVMQVCLPYFARSERETGSLVPAYVTSLSLLTAVGWPFLGVMAVIAFSAIRVIYGSQWTDAAPLAQILCLAMAIELVFALSREALLAKGEARRANLLQMQIVVAQIVGLLAVIPFGLAGACWGLVAAAAIGAALSQWHLGKTIGLHLQDMLRACRNSALLTAVTVIPLAGTAVLVPVSEVNYVRWGIFAAVFSVGVWLAAMRVMGHPLWREAEGLWAGLRSRARG
jgi:O-antigen/teichoic acid export membrane protein